MTTILEQTNNEKINGEAFSHLSSEMQGVVLHSLAEKLRNEEIMVKLSLSEKELKVLCTKYGVTYAYRNTDRRLDGEIVISDEELEALLQKGSLSFQDFVQYDRESQRKIVYAFVEKNDAFNQTIRTVFGVKFYNFFLAIYHKEKAKRKKKDPIVDAMVPVVTPKEEKEEKMPTEEELYNYLITPSESNPNDLTHLSDEWDSPFGVEKQYMIQFKNQKATKRQMKMKLRYLLEEIDELEDDALLSIDLKITEHTKK